MYAFLKNKKTRVAFGAAIGILFFVLIYYLRGIFIPFFTGLIIAYMLNPVVSKLEQKGVNRTLSIIFLFVLMFAVFFIMITMAVPAAFRQGRDLVNAIAGDEYEDVNHNGVYDPDTDRLKYERIKDGAYTKPLLLQFNEWFSDMANRFTKSPRIKDSLEIAFSAGEEYYETIAETIKKDLDKYIKEFLKSTFAIIAFIVSFLLVPVYAFFLLREMDRIKQGAIPLLPGKSRDDILRIAKKIDRAMAAFFRGRFIVCGICSIITWIGLWIIGIKYSFLFGVLIGSATVIPFLGLLFLAPTLLVAYFGDGGGLTPVVWATLLYGFVQTLQGSILDPVILGREVRIHPVVLILMFLISGKILGFIGLLLAVPIASILKILTQEFVLPSVRELAAEQETGLISRDALEENEDSEEHGKGTAAEHD